MASFQGIHQERESKRETERDGDICWPSNVLFRRSSEVQRGLENCPAITISASILKPLVCRKNYQVHKALGTKNKTMNLIQMNFLKLVQYSMCPKLLFFYNLQQNEKNKPVQCPSGLQFLETPELDA